MELDCPRCGGVFAVPWGENQAPNLAVARWEGVCLAARASARAIVRLLSGEPPERWPAYAAARLLATEALLRSPSAGGKRLECLQRPWRALALAWGRRDPGRAGGWLRPARLEDAEGIVALVESAYRGERSRQGWTTEADLLDGQRCDLDMVEGLIADPAGVLLLLGREDEMLACSHLQREGRRAWFGLFAVRPDAQGRGLGATMLAAAEWYAYERWRCQELRMKVISLRLELIAWYRRRGYGPTGETAPFPYGDPRYGLPRRPDLRFIVLAKALAPRPPPHRGEKK